MPKFTNAERNLVKSIVASLSLKRIPEKDIIDEIFKQTHKRLTQSGLFRVKKSIKKESYRWYKKMREGEYEYIHEFKGLTKFCGYRESIMILSIVVPIYRYNKHR